MTLEFVGMLFLRTHASIRAKFLSIAPRNSPSNKKTRRKFAGTDVALPKSHNVGTTSKGGELDSNRTTLATMFTERLRIASALDRAHGRVGTAESDGKAKSRKIFGDAMQNSQLVNRLVMGHPAHAVPLAVKEEMT